MLLAVSAAGLALTAVSCGAGPDTVEKGESTSENSPQAPKADKVQGKILESGFGQQDEYVYPVTLVTNLTDHGGQTVIVSGNFLDAGGKIVKTESQTESFNIGGQTLAVTTQVDVPKGVKVTAIEPTLRIKDEGTFEEAKVDFGIFDAAVAKGEYGGWTVTFPFKNPTSDALESPRVSIVCRDAAGKINGGGFTFPDLVPPSGEVTVDSDVNVSGQPASCKAYVGAPM